MRILLSGVVAISLFSTFKALSAEDPDALLQRIKLHISGRLVQLPKYTCREVIDRSIRTGSAWRHVDTVQVEAVFAREGELFARRGSERFGEQSIQQIAAGGTIGDSVLGAHIDSVIAGDAGEFKYVGECKKDGRKTIRFDLHVPVEKSRFHVRHSGVEAIAGYDGSIWVDAETLDPVRVYLKVNRIPPHIGVRLIQESLRYKKLAIGNSSFDLPYSSELTATDDSGVYSFNTVKLNGCREFSADSIVQYTVPSQGTASRDRQDHH